MLLFRDAKTGEIVVGADDKVEQCTYIAAITRIPEELDNELTGGWKVIEVRPRLPTQDCCSSFCRWDVAAPGLIYRRGKKSTDTYLILPYRLPLLLGLHNHYSLRFGFCKETRESYDHVG